jgi:hypothetical protein
MNSQLTCEGCGAWLNVLLYERHPRTLEDVPFVCDNCGQLNRFARIEIVPKQAWTIVHADAPEDGGPPT